MQICRVQYSSGGLPDCPEWILKSFTGLGVDLKELLREPACTPSIINGEEHLFVWYTPRIFWEWHKQSGMHFASDAVLELSSFAYAELQHVYLWGGHPNRYACYSLRDEQGEYTYPCEGLAALRQLFADEARSKKSFTSNGSISFADWQKGFYLALHRFGEEKIAEIVGRQILPLFQRDKAFVIAHAKSIDRARPRLREYRLFAYAWDNYFLPVRYWSKIAAWSLLRHWKRDEFTYNDFTKLFYHQDAKPKHNQAVALRGLEVSVPEVVTEWRGEGKNSEIVISKLGADKHGISIERCQEVLAQDIGVNVLVKN